MAKNIDKSRSSQVGYGKPPKYTQFVKGQSGNPKGRPKGRQNYAKIFRDICEEKIMVQGKDGPLKMTKYRAGVTQLVNKAVKGDLTAIREMKDSYESACKEEVFLNPPSLVINFVPPPSRDLRELPAVVTKTRPEND